MSQIVTITCGLVLWIVLWSLGVSGFDGMLIAILMALVVLGIRQVLPNLLGRRGP